MNLKSFLAKAAVVATQLDHALRAASTRHAVLTPYGSVSDLLPRYQLGGGLAPVEHSQISAALIDEVRASREVRWQLVLLSAHAPMLFHLLQRTGGRGREAAQGRAAVAFIEAVHTVNPGDGTKTLARLASRTNRIYWRLCRQEIGPRVVRLADDDFEDAASDDGGMGAIFVSPGELARMLSGMRDPKRMADVVHKTSIGDDDLREYLAAQKPANDNGVSDTELASMQRARTRAHERLREVFEEIDGPLSGF